MYEPKVVVDFKACFRIEFALRVYCKNVKVQNWVRCMEMELGT
jgi:hypothetical protein